MAHFLQQVVSGLASGGIYGLLALGIVLIHRATGVINFAQGEFATLSAFVCWALMDHGWAFWPAFGATIVLSFAGGVAVQQTLIRPIQGGPLVAVVILTVGLLLAINGLTTWIWGDAARQFHGPFSTGTVDIGGVALSKQDLGVVGVSLAAVILVGLLFRRTKMGLGLRAGALNPLEARLTGMKVATVLAAGWGLAAALGGLILGVLLSLVGTYVHWVDGQLKLAVALAVILGVLLVRPTGLFGSAAVRRA
jgi:branched-chain amino acid transport system permease protein